MPANSNFNAMAVNNCPNKLNIPPSNSIQPSANVFGSSEPSINTDIIIDVMKPTTPKQVSGTVKCRSKYKPVLNETFYNYIRIKK